MLTRKRSCNKGAHVVIFYVMFYYRMSLQSELEMSGSDSEKVSVFFHLRSQKSLQNSYAMLITYVVCFLFKLF